jgi:outer membrane protein TolC
VLLTTAGLQADPPEVLQGPILSEGPGPRLTPGSPGDADQPLPINLATALRLADARPLVISAAQASLQVALAELAQAKVLWLPDVYVGTSYYRHDGGGQGNSGTLFINGRNQFMAGGGLTAVFAATDAIFSPLAAKQVVKAREIDVQTARNDALLSMTEAYFNVQQARGRLAGALDTVAKGRELAKTIQSLARDLTPPAEVSRARAELAELEQAEALARQDWLTASADLTRVLRLNPASVVVPLEPPHLQLTLISPREAVDALIPIGLRSRPELASQQALVEATLIRIRQEKLRPLIPSVVLLGDAVPAAPGGYLMGGVFGSDTNQQGNPWTARNDVSVQVLWQLRNMGLGNRALVQQRKAEQQQSLVELYRIQDRVAAEVAQAHAQVVAARVRVGKAETGVKEAQKTYADNLKGLVQTTRFGDILVLVNRPQEVVAALAMLSRAYDNYYLSVNDYNRAQLRLYHALGYPSGILACERSPGPITPVDTRRPPEMAPVCAPEPCAPCPR